MSKKANKNSFEKMCDKLAENYVLDNNEIEYVRDYINSNVKDDMDLLLKLRAEALEEDFSVYQSNQIDTLAMVISAVGVVFAMLPKMDNIISSILRVIYLLSLLFATYKIGVEHRYDTVTKWRKYVLEVLNEEIAIRKEKE